LYPNLKIDERANFVVFRNILNSQASAISKSFVPVHLKAALADLKYLEKQRS